MADATGGFGKGTAVFVTGGAGFIGSHLCEFLLRRDCKVFAVDDLRSGNLDNLPLAEKDLHFEQLSVGDPSSIPRIEEYIRRCDFAFHLASPVGVALVHGYPSDTASSIVLAGVQVVNACRRHKCPLLFTSSSEVYGLTKPYPTSEDAPLTLSGAPRFSYAAAKLIVEHLVADLYRQLSLPSWIVRLFNVAGPRQRSAAGVVAAFAEMVSSDKALLIHGDGTQTRSFLHVADAVEAITLVADCRQLLGRPVNVGGDESVSINDLAIRFQAEVGGNGLVSRLDYREFFGENFLPVQKRLPDTRLLRKKTGWQPRFGLDDIIRDCLAEYALLDRKSG